MEAKEAAEDNVVDPAVEKAEQVKDAIKENIVDPVAEKISREEL